MTNNKSQNVSGWFFVHLALASFALILFMSFVAYIAFDRARVATLPPKEANNNPVLIREINGIEVFSFVHNGETVNVAIDYSMRKKVEEIYRRVGIQEKPRGSTNPVIGDAGPDRVDADEE